MMPITTLLRRRVSSMATIPAAGGSGSRPLDSNGHLTGQSAYFYGIGGGMLSAYTLTLGSSLTASNGYSSVYFDSKRVGVAPNGSSYSTFIQDRLGSQGSYYPYGEDKGTPLPNDQFKFATYWRDSATSLDYADQRYYVNNFGRFITPDPYQATATAPSDSNDPQTWNRYSYVITDPVNLVDPLGRFWVPSPPPPHPEPGGPPEAPSQQPIESDPEGPPQNGNGSGEKGPRNPNPTSPAKPTRTNTVQAYQACVAQVDQQDHATYLTALQFLEGNYLLFLELGAGGGAVAGGILGSGVPLYGSILGAYLGAHIGALTANEWHTDLTLLFTVLANTPRPLARSLPHVDLRRSFIDPGRVLEDTK